MPTRANIIIRENTTGTEVVLYSHYDGYPDGVGKDLKNTLSDFCQTEKWHINPSNLTAAIMTSNTFNYIYEYKNKSEEISPIHGDIEYLYIIEIGLRNQDVKLACYKAPEIGSDMWNKYKYWNEQDYLDENLIFTQIFALKEF